VKTVLAIDTSSDEFALAVANDGVIVRSLGRNGAHDHSRLLLSAIGEVLGNDRPTLSGIVAVRGPGSYAGLRVGIATAQGLALSAGAWICGVGTLEAVAAARRADDVVAIHPVGRGEFAYQRFAGSLPTGALAVATAEDIGSLRGLAGEGAGALSGVEVTPEARCRAALALGLSRLASSDGDVEAIYLREPNISTPRRRVAS
jgi:tRNA threonylcarbamoyladenosine biosynthesis protein TsaB